MRKFSLLLFSLFLLVPRLAETKSLALIIGNESYSEIEPLQKARADAEGYAALFEAEGFAVTLAIDLPARDMLETLASFYDSIDPGDTVVFAYSGHGWSDGQQNYLIPTDIRAGGSPTLLAAESFVLRNGVNGILDLIAERAPALTVAIIDACRNNPFKSEGLTRSAVLSRGLVRMQPPTGTFIAFSAGEGQTALDRLSDDDPSPYSVFTRVFLGELALPQDLQSAFKTTQQRVHAIAQTIGHPQRPAYYDEVVGSACIDSRCRIEADADDIATGSVEPKGAAAERAGDAEPSAIAAREWQDFRDTTSVEALEAFARRHEGTVYAILARARIAELTEAAAKTDPSDPAPNPPESAKADRPEEAAPPKAPPDGADSKKPERPPFVASGPPPKKDEEPGKAKPEDIAAAPPPSGPPSPRRPGKPASPPRSGVVIKPPPAEPKPQPWCATTTDKVEQTICGNPRLAALHLKVDSLVLARHGALDPEARRALLQSHHVWKEGRDSCGANPACIEDFLHARIEALGRSVWRASATPPQRL